MAKECNVMTVRIEPAYKCAVELFDAFGTDLTSALRMLVNIAVFEGCFPITPHIPAEAPNLDLKSGAPSPRP